MKVAAIILCAGQGTRMQSNVPKTLLLLKNQPLFVYALKAFEDSELIERIVLVVPTDQLRIFRSVVVKGGFKKVSKIVAGGETRAASVFNGLKALKRRCNIVAIHDGARPFITRELINQSINLAKKEKAVILAVPVKATVKKADPKSLVVDRTIDRSQLWEVQTPQTFDFDMIFKAHQNNLDPNVTDDALLIERMSQPVKILKGSYSNIKVTTKEDLILAKAFLNDEI